MVQILVIDNDEIYVDILKKLFEKDGHLLTVCRCLSEAHELFSTEIQLIITEAKLPDGDSLNFLRSIRKYSTVPFIVLSTCLDEFTQISFFSFKADAYISKAFSPSVISYYINALANRFYPLQQPVKINGYIFDLDNYSLKCEKNIPIPLTATEMQIIKILYDRKGTTVSREHLLETIWGNEYRDDYRRLDPHIKNIRKKLDYSFVTTIIGIGYKLTI
ncbi:response regulator transcription factor [Enterococcus sp. DIV1298c]|uniref:response regulator transcription factor n=1 Tax=Enterococcus sp. DIV1298c TaxID=2815328 RepID=UPI001A9219ED|nr:response regulator transcription factor [Enterococcus sp. DIV1298c]MBO0462289.1 response regulator transcription factor [Enterococcus sp. DIV1298c]